LAQDALHSVDTLTLRAQCQSAQMSKITNDSLIRCGTGCFTVVPIGQQWASNGYVCSYLATCARL